MKRVQGGNPIEKLAVKTHLTFVDPISDILAFIKTPTTSTLTNRNSLSFTLVELCIFPGEL